MESNSDNSLDNILVEIGDFGRYQIFVVILVSFAVILFSAVDVSYMFITMDVPYRCEIPTCDSAIPEYEPSWLTDAVPYKEGIPRKCYKFENINNSSGIYNQTCTSKEFDRNNTLRCSSFVYKTPERSILHEYNLQCDDNLWKTTMIGSINNIGQFFGEILCGVISDKYGRRVVLVSGMILCATCSILRATFLPSFEWFVVLEFMNGVFDSGTYICGIIFGVELVGPQKRVLVSTLICCCYALGEIFTATSAWMVKSWKPLIYIIYTPRILLLIYFWVLPESVRWNISKGRLTEAKQILRKIAKVNGKTVSDEVVEQIRHLKGEPEKDQTPFREALKSKKLMLRLVNCCFCWITCILLFFGLTLNSVSLDDGNRYVDFILTALVEIPAYIFCNYVLDIFGRRKSLSASYLLTGAACISFTFISAESHVGLIVYLIGKFGATTAFTIIYVLTSEIFPTNMRHSFMGVCSTFGRLGSMIAPQAPLLAQIWAPLPLLGFATMAIIAGFLTLLFPETLNTKLPDTIEEAKNISKFHANLPTKQVENDPLMENSV